MNEYSSAGFCILVLLAVRIEKFVKKET